MYRDATHQNNAAKKAVGNGQVIAPSGMQTLTNNQQTTHQQILGGKFLCFNSLDN